MGSFIGSPPPSGPYSRYDFTRAPTVSDDSTAGFTVGSEIADLTTGVLWRCTDAAVGAARWHSPDHPGFRTGRWWPAYAGSTGSGSAIPAANTIYAHAFFLARKVALTAIGARLGTADAGKLAKFAVWANSNANDATIGLPIGAPVAVVNTGQSLSATGIISGTVAVTLDKGWYHFGVKTDGTASQWVGPSQSDSTLQAIMGRTTLTGNTHLTGIALADTFANSMPTLTGGESWTDVITNGPAAGMYKN